MKRLAPRLNAGSGFARVLERGLMFIACALIILSFSTTKPHNFADHFRMPEVSLSTVRIVFVAQGEDGKRERIVQIGRDLALVPAIEPERDSSLIADTEPPDCAASTNRVKFHRRLGSPPSNPEEAHF
jgi:hypothetical protein